MTITALLPLLLSLPLLLLPILLLLSINQSIILSVSRPDICSSSAQELNI